MYWLKMMVVVSVILLVTVLGCRPVSMELPTPAIHAQWTTEYGTIRVLETAGACIYLARNNWDGQIAITAITRDVRGCY